jgi:hypothetical protein
MAGGPPRPSATSGAVWQGARADAATQQAIQDVIRHAAAAQAQAVASGDPTPMADSATTGYYEQLVYDNQHLLEQGVAAIELVGVEWGTITTRDGTAIVSVYETWSTTHADTTAEQSRALAVYTLVGSVDTWRIQSEAHPDENQRPTDAQPAGADNPSLRAPDSHQQSRNWSGYAASGDTFTGVSATWTVPQFAPDSPALDSFGRITFSQASAIKDGRAVSVAGAGGRAITMIGPTGEPLAEPSARGGDGASLTISRTWNPARLRRG